MVKLNVLLGILLLGVILVSGCGGFEKGCTDDLSCDDPNYPICEGDACVAGNSAPIVSISSPGVNADFDEGVSVSLIGSATDSDGDSLTVSWNVSPSVGVVISDPTAQVTSAVFNVPGSYDVSFSASDGEDSDSQSVFITINPKSGESQVFKSGVWVQAKDGDIISPMITDGESVFVEQDYWSDDGGSVSFTFDILETGTYYLNTKVSAPSASSNSLYVGLNLENAAGNADYLWNVPITNGFEEKMVVLSGSADKHIWNLEAGDQTFYFYGREDYTKLKEVKLVKLSGNTSCECSNWVDVSCGAGSCNDNEMLQTRTCTPSGCDITEQCVVTSECGSSGDKIITDVLFDWNTHYRDAINADLWPMTWGADGRVWTSWGDGSGFPYEFNREEKVTIGFAYFEGIPGTSSFKGVNVWGGENPIYPIQDEWDCPHECGKVGSMLSVNGVLYAFYSPWTSKYDEPIASKRKQLHRSQIMYSTNNGETWQVTDWYYDNLNVPFFPHEFLNFGQDYAGARDNYVYMYGSDWRSSATYTDVFLARVPKDKILDKNAYEYFSGTSNSPAWSKNMYDRKKVLYEPKEIGALAVIYNKGLDRYIMTGHNTDYMGKWTIYEAPEPWGPWKIVKQYDDWHGTGDVHAGMAHSFPTKWISEDGTEMWMTFSGSLHEGEEWDSFNMIKVTFVLDGENNDGNTQNTNNDINDIRANQPKNFRLTSSGDDVTLRWDWNENAPVSAFKVYRSETGNEPWVRPSGGKIYDSSARMFVDKDLQIGKRYHYIVQAVHGSPEVNSLISQDKQIIVGGGEPDDVIPSPTNVKASYDGNTITLTWDYEPKAGVSLGGFKIDKSYEYGSWERPDGGRIVNTNARSFVDEPNLPSGVYMYRVFGWYSGNNYPFSETVAVKIENLIPGTVKIMPLGDSITHGVHGSATEVGYRRKLYLDLVNAGYDIDFVGSLTTGTVNDFDKDHEGHGGWHADETYPDKDISIANNIKNWLDKNPADIVLLHIGTNDISSSEPIQTTVDDVTRILNLIDEWEIANNKKVTVILAKIIGRKGSTAQTKTNDYNDKLSQMAQQRISNGDNILVVDMTTVFDITKHLTDSVHPNQEGYDKMAEIWLDAFKKIY